jgi:N-acylneuraminate cytidylyltransferase
MLAVIPARGGSKGLPGKNLRPLAGLPLIAHSIRLAQMCPDIRRVIVTTDSPQIAQLAREFGADVPFVRPAELARDDTPMWPVLRHALEAVTEPDDRSFRYLLLLDPTSPGRFPEDIAGAVARLNTTPAADGIVGVSIPEFNPLWHCVVERQGWMEDLMPGAEQYTRRQDVPTVFRINATLYIWRTEFVRREADGWRGSGRHLVYEVPESRAIHIDDLEEFRKAEALIRHGLVRLPWLASGETPDAQPA